MRGGGEDNIFCSNESVTVPIQTFYLDVQLNMLSRKEKFVILSHFKLFQRDQPGNEYSISEKIKYF